MAKVVSMLNMKGGVGKTTLTYNLAWYAAQRGHKVLAIDLDPQSNLTQTFMGDAGYHDFLASTAQSVADIFEKSSGVTAGIMHKVEEGTDGSLIHLVPARIELSKTIKNPAAKEHKLRRFLARYKPHYDLVLIDCPPTDSILTDAAYYASDCLVIPVKLEKLAIIGLPLLKCSIDEFNAENTGEYEISVAGIIFNDVESGDPPSPEHRICRRDVNDFAKQNGWHVFEHEVKQSKAYVNSIRESKPMSEALRSREKVVEQFFSVGEEFLRRVGVEREVLS